MKNDQNITKITSIEELNSYKNGEVVQLPDFAEGQPFFARLRRPSLLVMAKRGKIPNALLQTATELFVGKSNSKFNTETLKNMFEIIDVICEASFLEPTYQELKDNEIELTDDQMTFIFNYAQSGTKALESFRQ